MPWSSVPQRNSGLISPTSSPLRFLPVIDPAEHVDPAVAPAACAAVTISGRPAARSALSAAPTRAGSRSSRPKTACALPSSPTNSRATKRRLASRSRPARGFDSPPALLRCVGEQPVLGRRPWGVTVRALTHDCRLVDPVRRPGSGSPGTAPDAAVSAAGARACCAHQLEMARGGMLFRVASSSSSRSKIAWPSALLACAAGLALGYEWRVTWR